MPVPRAVHYVALTPGQKVHISCFEPFFSNDINFLLNNDDTMTHLQDFLALLFYYRLHKIPFGWLP